jgi:hypothetical protein
MGREVSVLAARWSDVRLQDQEKYAQVEDP